MSGKIKLIILVVLMIVSFAAAFLATRLFSSKPPPQPGPEIAKVRLPNAMPGEEEGLVSPDDKQVSDLVKTLRARIDMYNQKLQELTEKEKRLQKTQEDLKKQADELADLQAKLNAPLNNLKTQIEDLKKTQVVIKQDHRENLVQIASVYAKMAPAEASQVLQTMCSNRQDEDAAKILYFVSLQSDRQAGKIVDSFSDKAVAARLVELMKRIRDESRQTSESGT